MTLSVGRVIIALLALFGSSLRTSGAAAISAFRSCTAMRAAAVEARPKASFRAAASTASSSSSSSRVLFGWSLVVLTVLPFDEEGTGLASSSSDEP
jgi:hypothetical protein